MGVWATVEVRGSLHGSLPLFKQRIYEFVDFHASCGSLAGCQTQTSIQTHHQTARSQILLYYSPTRRLTTSSSSVSAWPAPMNKERTEASLADWMPTDPTYTDPSADRQIPNPALLLSCSVTNSIEFIRFGMASTHEWRKD